MIAKSPRSISNNESVDSDADDDEISKFIFIVVTTS